jgi:DNA-binding CsgD family transcriptional regulator/PAS domain-containing protein
MSEIEQANDLVAAIYDAALDPAQWSGVLERTAAFVGGRAAGLLVRHADRRHLDVMWQCGVDERYMRLYAETYAALGPLARWRPSAAEQIVDIAQIMPREDFLSGRFYREWAQPQGWTDVAIVALTISASSTAFLTVARDEAAGMVDDAMRRGLARLAPHLRRAVQIAQTLEFRRTEAATLAGVLDGLSAGLFLVDARSRIVHVNAAGQRILAASDVLRPAGGLLACRDPRLNGALRETVAAAAGASGDSASGRRGVAMPLSATDGARYVVHVLPLRSGVRCRVGGGEAAVAVFVRKAALDGPPSSEVIGRTYGLTPAELRVLSGIVEIGGVPEVAAALGVSDATVKTHLGRLFGKTGTARQADLVKLVAGYAMPIAC